MIYSFCKFIYKQKLKKKENSTLHNLVIPSKNNKVLHQAIEIIKNSEEINTLWKVANVTAINRLEMTDHGPVHVQIVANSALRMARLLSESGIALSIEKDYELHNDYAELVVVLASLFHDLGMTIHRNGHEEFSLIIANDLLLRILQFLPEVERTIVKSEVLHAIISHRSGGKPLTIEAGLVRVADALDMTKGRSRIPYEAGSVNIHSVSAAAIDEVVIQKGTKKPIEVSIVMNNSVGLFQFDDLLSQKLKGSGIEKYITIQTFVAQKQEKNMFDKIVIE